MGPSSDPFFNDTGVVKGISSRLACTTAIHTKSLKHTHRANVRLDSQGGQTSNLKRGWSDVHWRLGQQISKLNIKLCVWAKLSTATD